MKSYNWKIAYTTSALAIVTIAKAEENFAFFKKVGMTDQCRDALNDIITLRGIMQDNNLARQTTDLLNYLAIYCKTAV